MIFKFLGLLLLSILLFCQNNLLHAQWVATPSPTQYGLQSVQVINEKEAFIGGSEGIYRTQDGGTSWKRYRLPANPMDSLNVEYMQTNHIHFTSPKVGFSAGWNLFNFGMVLKTVDGGVNWKVVYTGPPLGTSIDVTFRAITFVNEKVGYIAGTKGSVLKTIDAGETWTPVPVNIPVSEKDYSYFNSVFFLNETDGYVAGSEFYYTQDGGKTWNEVAHDQYYGFIFNDIHFFDSNNGIAALLAPQFSAFGRVPIFKTSDGGRSWLPAVQPDLPQDDGSFILLNDLHFADNQNGYAVGYKEAWKTKDGGNTWERLNFTPAVRLSKVHTHKDVKGVMVGENGKIYSTNNFNEATRPLASFLKPEISQYCANTSYTFKNRGPQYYNYKWYVNGILAADTYNLTTTFEAGKDYEIKLVSEHNGLTDFSVKYIKTEPNHVFTKFSFKYYDTSSLLCSESTFSLGVYGSRVIKDNYYAYDFTSRYELWAEGKLLDVVENKSGEFDFKKFVANKTITFTVKAIIKVHCETYTQEESITFNFAPTPDLTLEVQEVEDIYCPNSGEFKLKIKNSQIGFMYAVKRSNSGYNSDFDKAYEGNGGDLIITTPFNAKDDYENTTPTSISEREIVVYTWFDKCTSYSAKPLLDKAIMRTSNFNMKIEVEKNHLLVNEPLKVTNLSVADEFRWIVTDGLTKTEYTTAQLPQISFTTSGIKLVELFVSKHGKCTNTTRFEVVVGTPAPGEELTACNEQDISYDPKKADDYVNYQVNRIITSHTDKNGFIYTTGSQKGRLFLSKYDSSGKLQWTRNHWSGGYQGYSLGSAIITDSEGNVYLGGHSTTSQFSFGSVTLESSTYYKYLSFIIKLDPEGNTEWIIKNDPGLKGGWLNIITDLAIDKNQNIYAVVKSSAFVDISFPDGSKYEGFYRKDQEMPKYASDFIYPTLLLKTNTQGDNLGITVLHEKGITHDLNYADPHAYWNWQYFSSPQLEIKDDKAYLIGSRTVKAEEAFYIMDYKIAEDVELMQKYPNGGVQGYIAILDLVAGNVEYAFNTFFQEHIDEYWHTQSQWSFTVPYAFTSEGIIVGYSWGNRYSKDSYNNSEIAEDILVGKKVYKGIHRGSLTAAYDWNGNNLWSATSHDAFINSYYYDKNTSKLYAYARLNNLAMIGSNGTENLSIVDVDNSINTGFIIYSDKGIFESVKQATGQATSEVPFSLTEGACGTLYITSGVLERVVDPFINQAYIYNHKDRLRSISLTGDCAGSTTIVVPFLQKNICKGEAVQLSLEGPDIISVKWSPELSLDNPASKSPVATPLVSTTYYATIETAGGCTVTRTIRIDVDEPLTVTGEFTAKTRAYSTQAEFTPPVVEGGNNYIYKWNFGDDSPIAIGKGVYTHDFKANGTYNVVLTISNACTEKTIVKPVTVPCTPVVGPTASISFTQKSTEVSFKMLNPQNVDSWEWYFGDGTTSKEQNPVHTYAPGAIYNVILKVRNACIENTYYSTVSLACPSTAIYPGTLVNRQNVTFWIVGVANENIQKWEFGDGTESNEKVPTHTYKKPGRYTATVFIEHVCGSTTRSVVIDVACYNLSAEFTADIEQSKVSFRAAENAGNVTYLWDFGDGQTSTAVSPVHTYANSGKYLVKLTLKDECGERVFSREVEICISPASSDFTFTMQTGNPRQVSFKPVVLNSAMKYEWHFGDGNTSEAVSPVHTYSTTGQFLAILITRTNCDTDSAGITIDLPAGILNDSDNKLVNIYPNPVREILYLEMDPAFSNTISSITLHDALGRTLYNKNGTGVTTVTSIDIHKLSTGNYFLRIRRKDGNYVIKKFVVQH